MMSSHKQVSQEFIEAAKEIYAHLFNLYEECDCSSGSELCEQCEIFDRAEKAFKEVL